MDPCFSASTNGEDGTAGEFLLESTVPLIDGDRLGEIDRVDVGSSVLVARGLGER